MRDIAALVNLAFKLTHEAAELALDLERLPELRGHRFYAVQLADAGVSALAHVASASASYSFDYKSRMEARASLRGARDCLATLKRLLRTLQNNGYLDPDRVDRILEKVDEASAVTMALGVELRGGGQQLRHAS